MFTDDATNDIFADDDKNTIDDDMDTDVNVDAVHFLKIRFCLITTKQGHGL